jgi:hypothetical protein
VKPVSSSIGYSIPYMNLKYSYFDFFELNRNKMLNIKINVHLRSINCILIVSSLLIVERNIRINITCFSLYAKHYLLHDSMGQCSV